MINIEPLELLFAASADLLGNLPDLRG